MNYDSRIMRPDEKKLDKMYGKNEDKKKAYRRGWDTVGKRILDTKKTPPRGGGANSLEARTKPSPTRLKEDYSTSLSGTCGTLTPPFFSTVP